MFWNHQAVRQRYRYENGVACIDLQVDQADQLFDVRDPAPFRARDLDDDAVVYIVGSVRELGVSTPIKLVVSVADTEYGHLGENLIQGAIHSYFEYETLQVNRRLRLTFREGQISFFIGLCVLFSFIFISQQIQVDKGDLGSRLVYEGLNVMGWVAMWHPINILLYAWWPILSIRRIYQKLSVINVEVKYTGGE